MIFAGGTAPWLAVIVLWLVWMTPAPARAQSCSIAATAGSYGTLDILSGAPQTSTAAMSIHCNGTPGASVRLCVEADAGTANAATQRVLTDGEHALLHELYVDSGTTTPLGSWGVSTARYASGLALDVPLDASGNAAVTRPVIGVVAANQQKTPPGAYVWTGGNLNLAFQYLGPTTPACPFAGQINVNYGVMTWSATVSQACLLRVTGLDFGSKGLLSSEVRATGALDLICTNATPYQISLDGGLSNASSPTARRAVNGAGSITYGLYRDAAHQQPWGWAAGDLQTGIGTGTTRRLIVYGRVPPQTSPSAGTYIDTVVVTVQY